MKFAHEVMSLEKAVEWFLTKEKFVFCIELLEISAHRADADARVNVLETGFEQLLAAEADQVNDAAERAADEAIATQSNGRIF